MALEDGGELAREEMGCEVQLGPRGDLVAEELRLLVRVARAACGAQEREEEDVPPVGGTDPGQLGEVAREQADAERVVGRVPGRRIGGLPRRPGSPGLLILSSFLTANSSFAAARLSPSLTAATARAGVSSRCCATDQF